MIPSGGVCRVCGTALAPPLVSCPRCERPHHRDCWDYNAGCSTYGCIEHLPMPVEDAGLTVQPVSGAELYFDIDPRTNVPIACVLGTMALRFTPTELWPLTFAFLGALAKPYFDRWRARRADAHEVVKMLEMDSESVTLESKALAALIGDGAPHQLAQAYALFEQRHPRRALAPEQQAALGLELADAGYDVLALEAFDKGLKQEQPERAKLVARRDELLAGEPAYATIDVDPTPGKPPRPLTAGAHAAALRRVLVDEVQASQLVVISLSPGSFPWQVLRQPDGGSIAGPYTQGEARALACRLWDAGHPAALAPASALTLPDVALPLTGAQLSQASARLTTPKGEITVAWSDVRAVIYGLLVVRESDNFRPVVELHLADMRLRVLNPEPDMFRYLGRRMQYTVDENLKLFAKDLVRFAPHARFSHGVLGLLMERQLPGSRFEGIERLEAYARWFAALGAVRERYRSVTVSAPG